MNSWWGWILICWLPVGRAYFIVEFMIIMKIPWYHIITKKFYHEQILKAGGFGPFTYWAKKQIYKKPKPPVA